MTWHFQTTPKMSTYLGKHPLPPPTRGQRHRHSVPLPQPRALHLRLAFMPEFERHVGRMLSIPVASLPLPAPCPSIGLPAVCFILGEFVSTSRLVQADAGRSVNVSVWGTPDRHVPPRCHDMPAADSLQLTSCSWLPALAPPFIPIIAIQPRLPAIPPPAHVSLGTPCIIHRCFCRLNNLQYAVEVAAAILPAYEAALGVEYPLDKLDLVVSRQLAAELAPAGPACRHPSGSSFGLRGAAHDAWHLTAWYNTTDCVWLLACPPACVQAIPDFAAGAMENWGGSGQLPTRQSNSLLC